MQFGVFDALFCLISIALGVMALHRMATLLCPMSVMKVMCLSGARLMAVPVALHVTAGGSFDSVVYFEQAQQGGYTDEWGTLGTAVVAQLIIPLAKWLGLSYASCFLPFWFASSLGALFIVSIVERDICTKVG